MGTIKSRIETHTHFTPRRTHLDYTDHLVQQAGQQVTIDPPVSNGFQVELLDIACKRTRLPSCVSKVKKSNRVVVEEKFLAKSAGTKTTRLLVLINYEIKEGTS